MTSTAKAYRGIGMEGAIATWYARNTGHDLSRFIETARAIAERVPAESRILEVAPGPGYLAIELARRNYEVTTLDISESFVRIARDNAHAAGVAIDVRHGSASAMPFDDRSFDFIVCTAAFKNFSDPLGALNEMHRVLRHCGETLIIDLRKDATLAEIAAEVRTMRLSPWNAWMTRQTFRFLLLKRAYTAAQLSELAARSRFAGAAIVSKGIGVEVTLAKR
jgi:ubiquinone/menaquinone biosynthesis C-methylase UbiE